MDPAPGELSRSPTQHGDFTHDGVDIRLLKDHPVPVLTVDPGATIHSEWVNDAFGYEVYLLLGYDADGERVNANYVHMDEVLPSVGAELEG